VAGNARPNVVQSWFGGAQNVTVGACQHVAIGVAFDTTPAGLAKHIGGPIVAFEPGQGRLGAKETIDQIVFGWRRREHQNPLIIRRKRRFRTQRETAAGFLPCIEHGLDRRNIGFPVTDRYLTNERLRDRDGVAVSHGIVKTSPGFFGARKSKSFPGTEIIFKDDPRCGRQPAKEIFDRQQSIGHDVLDTPSYLDTV